MNQENSTKIKYEELQISFAEIKANFDRYAATYNKNPIIEERMKIDTQTGANDMHKAALKIGKTYRETFYEIARLFIYQLRMYQRRKPDHYFDVLDPDPLSTNRKILADRLGTTKQTIWRHIVFFEKTRVLEKEFHGSNRNFDLFINPDILGIEKNFPEIHYKVQNTENQSDWNYCKNSKITKCYDITVSGSNDRDIIMNVDKEVEQSSPIFKETDQEHKSGNREKVIGNKRQNKHQVTTKKSYAEVLRRREKTMQKMQQSYSRWLVSRMMALLLPEQEVYPGEYERTVDYVAEKYFGNCGEYIQFDRYMGEYLERLEMAGRYKRRTSSYQAPFPYSYFDVGNTRNGFVITKKWYKQSLQWAQTKKRKRKEKSENEKLLEIIKKYHLQPTVQQYRRCENYVRDNIPGMLDTFYIMIRNK